MSDKTWKRWQIVLVLGCILATVKLIFVDYTMDEEYQIVMAYRRVMGDSLFGTMWEPHQTSAFLCTILLKFFMTVTGGTEFAVIYLRICTTLIQVGLACWLYRVLCGMTDKKYAFLMSICYFNLVPKMIQIPEFANMQLWFFTVSVLALIRYSQNRKKFFLVIAGVGMALEVLSYPACLILFPFFCVWLLLASEPGQKWKDILLFGGTCFACALLWLGRVLTRVSLAEFIRNLKNAVLFDSTHDLNLAEQSKGSVLLGECLENGLLLLITFVVAAGLFGLYSLLSRKRGKAAERSLSRYFVFVVFAAELVQIVYWIIFRVGYEKPQIITLVMLVTAAFLWKRAECSERGPGLALVGTLVVIGGVLYLSDLGVWNALAHGTLGVVFASLILIRGLEKESGKQQAARWILFCLLSLTVVGIFGKAVPIKDGKTETNTIAGIRNVVRHGPAKGIFTGYMKAYTLNCCYEDFLNYVEAGEKCLIVTNMVDAAGTTPYMMNQYEVCHFSIVDPTTYDEKLLTYWEAYPEKYPDVIIVDCWYGQPMVEQDSWIMRYIEEEFGYREVVDGRYVRFYRR